MTKRQGIGPVGCFSVMAGQYSPALIVITDYPSLGEFQSALAKIQADAEYLKASEAFEKAPATPYVRYESVLLKAFASHPKMEIPPALPNNATRVFELRTYESRSNLTLRAKIDMFNQEEIKIFKDCGFANIFFGEAICGTRLPQLTYMVGFDSMEARDKAWRAFGGNPDWARIRGKAGWTDPEAVSNIHASFLRPTGFSQVR